MSTNIKNSDGSLTKIASKTLQYPLNNNFNSNEALQDAPVGHIISYMGTIVPAHYLICDGSTYNISDYPKLAEHFFINFGSKNYFGGDGTTTFGVPDLRGEFLRGAGTNSHANQGNGGNIGVHQDATNQVAAIGGSSNQLTFKGLDIQRAVTDPDVVSATSTQFFIGTSSTYNIGETMPSAFTSRPTNTSVLYCIKAEPTYYMEVNDPGYSTDEVFTGKAWTDGRPIYRKTFNVDIRGTSYTIECNTYFPNCKGLNFIHIEGIYSKSGTQTYRNINYEIDYNNSSSPKILITSQNGDTMWTSKIIIEYTKTTD